VAALSPGYHRRVADGAPRALALFMTAKDDRAEYGSLFRASISRVDERDHALGRSKYWNHPIETLFLAFSLPKDPTQLWELLSETWPGFF
jgi:hypothetical protein